ncbi:MAG: hypothetical protein JXB48_24305 [Candidatus Latescibacteria bacterium]|nr:hypothetical protein [Candidatus Latescibacterota bacterium]
MLHSPLSLRNRLFYSIKPVIPRRLQILIRRSIARKLLPEVGSIWPIDTYAGGTPSGWVGWPNGNKFAFLLAHDVDTARGLENCRKLMDIDEKMGFRSTFNIVPERYVISAEMLQEIRNRGFGLGVHGLKHDGKLFSSRRVFLKRAARINRYLKEWKTGGFSSPSMHHNLSWMHALDLECDTSTFDTDPFEPQSDGVRTIFPFWVTDPLSGRSYLELPYTIPQDFTLFCILKEKDITIWKRKIDWIVKKGGMALLNTHPDYMDFSGKSDSDLYYPHSRYIELLEYMKSTYSACYWNACSEEVVRYFKTTISQERNLS